MRTLRSTVTPATIKVPRDWGYRWLAESKCAQGCWEGIVPGRTSVAAAKQIVAHHLLTFSGTTTEPGLERVMLWNMDNQAVAYIGLGNSDPESISYVQVRFPFTSFPLSEVVQSLGNPDYVDAWISTHQLVRRNVMSYVFADRGLAVSVDAQLDDPQIDLASAAYSDLLVFVPGLQGYLASRWPGRSSGGEAISRWSGFRGFRYYCRPTRGGTPC